MRLNFTLFLFVSLYSFKVSAQPCNQATPLPYSQTFQSATPPILPPCTINQTVSPGLVSGYYWQTDGPTSNGNIYLNVSYVDPTYRNIHWFYLPMMYFEAIKSYKVSYKYSSDNPNPTSAQTFAVYFGTCTINTCMTNLITTGIISNTSYITTTKVFSPPTSGNYYIGFNHADRPGYPGNSTVLDSIVVEDNGPLPVNMSALSYTKTNEITKLVWQTYSEQNNQGFQIEQSIDGVQFRNIGFIPTKASNGNSQLPLPYEFSVPASVLSIGKFYRLKQIDKDNRTSFSNIINIQNLLGGGRPVLINGNPVNDLLHLTVTSHQAQKALIKITDQSGWLLIKKEISLGIGVTFLDQPLKGLSTGIYYLTITDQKEKPLQSPLAFTKQ